MFYETKNRHGLPHDPFKSCVSPRPIGWITTLDEAGGVNLAPYSFFNAVASAPPLVMFANNGTLPNGAKDTIRNCEATGEFVVNVATWDLRFAMAATSAPEPTGVDEMRLAGLEAAPSHLIKPPRVKASPIHMECKYLRTIDLPATEGHFNAMAVGHVVGIHIDESVMTDGLIDVTKLKPIARLGYKDYAVVTEPFTLPWPSRATAKKSSTG